MDRNPLIVIVGPTAVGKSSFAMRLAREIDGEIVSGDSRQVYRHMDIGTAKPSPDDRKLVPHHLIDILDPGDDFSLALFLRLANEAIQSIHSRDRVPILAGGTGQYVTALVQGWQVPEVSPDTSLREQLEQRALQEGGDALYQELQALDPGAADRIDRRNVRRVIRALEIRQSESQQAVLPHQPPPYGIFMLGLTAPRPELYKRIDERVDAMISQGWLQEVETLLKEGYSPKLPSMSSLGYQELTRVLAGEWSLKEAVARIKTRTHRFARQQYSWFKPDNPDIRWFDLRINNAENGSIATALTEAKRFLEAT